MCVSLQEWNPVPAGELPHHLSAVTAVSSDDGRRRPLAETACSIRLSTLSLNFHAARLGFCCQPRLNLGRQFNLNHCLFLLGHMIPQ